MFNKKSNTAFKQAVDLGETIEGMREIHSSIQRLYTAAKTLKDVSGQSAVARLVGVGPQVMKNWEARGISENGALKAQARIGCDANWLLDESESMQAPLWRPPQALSASEQQPTYLTDRAWPFRHVSREQFGQLTVAQLDLVEQNILMFLAAREPPESQRPPGSYGTAA